jgi:hypothetical protein
VGCLLVHTGQCPVGIMGAFKDHMCLQAASQLA